MHRDTFNDLTLKIILLLQPWMFLFMLFRVTLLHLNTTHDINIITIAHSEQIYLNISCCNFIFAIYEATAWHFNRKGGSSVHTCSLYRTFGLVLSSSVIKCTTHKIKKNATQFDQSEVFFSMKSHSRVSFWKLPPWAFWKKILKN